MLHKVLPDSVLVPQSILVLLCYLLLLLIFHSPRPHRYLGASEADHGGSFNGLIWALLF